MFRARVVQHSLHRYQKNLRSRMKLLWRFIRKFGNRAVLLRCAKLSIEIRKAGCGTNQRDSLMFVLKSFQLSFFASAPSYLRTSREQLKLTRLSRREKDKGSPNTQTDYRSSSSANYLRPEQR